MVTKKLTAVHNLQTPSVKGFRKISTLRGDFIILSSRTSTAQVAPDDQMAFHLLPKMASAMSKPGLSKNTVFRSSGGRTIYAYSIDPSNPEQLIREDASGNKTPGRISGASFRRNVDA